MEITRNDILQLANEANAHGDGEMSNICNLALAGDSDSWRECERVIADNEAQWARDDLEAYEAQR